MKTDYEESLLIVARILDPLALEPMRGPGPRGEELMSEESRQLSHQHRATYAKRKAERILSSLGFEPDLATLTQLQQEAKRLREINGELEKSLKECSHERRELIEGICHAQSMLGEVANKFFDEDPPEGSEGSPERRAIRSIDAHLSGTLIDDIGKFMPREKYDAALARSEAATKEAK